MVKLLRFGRSKAPHRKEDQRLRRRLTRLYGILSVVTGVALLLITYALLAGSQDTSAPVIGRRVERLPPVPPGAAPVPDRIIEERPADQQEPLLVVVVALAIMTLVSIGLGWLFAGRVLSPVRTMTVQLQQISARNLHERLAVTGPDSEIKELADTIDSLLARLEVALEGHKRFVANAAHELRTPLTVEHALLEEPLIDPDADVESFRQNFQRLLVISEQRARLLESLLTLSGSEHGRDQYQELDLAQVVTQAVVQRGSELERLGLQVDTMVVPAPIIGDPALVERLVVNVLDNATHHNKVGGWVEIGTRAEAGRAALFVTNSGPVVPPEEVERIVEPFQRMHRVADDEHQGLGLSIVRAISTAHDAQLTVQARVSGGLFVEVVFPSLESSEPAPGELPRTEPASI